MTRSSPESKVAVIVMGWQPCDLSGDVCLQDRLDEDTGPILRAIIVCIHILKKWKV